PHNGDDVSRQVGRLILRGVLGKDITGGEFDFQIPLRGQVVICQPADVSTEYPASVPVQHADVAGHGEVVAVRVDVLAGVRVLDVLNGPDRVLSEHELLSSGGDVPVGVGGLPELPPGHGFNPG